MRARSFKRNGGLTGNEYEAVAKTNTETERKREREGSSNSEIMARPKECMRNCLAGPTDFGAILSSRVLAFVLLHFLCGLQYFF